MFRAGLIVKAAGGGGVVRRAVLRVAGVGCEGCVAPSRALFIKAEGVRSVKVLGSRVEVVYDESVTTIREVIEKSGASKYYLIEVEAEEALAQD